MSSRVAPVHTNLPLHPERPSTKENPVVYGGGILITILVILAIIYLARRV